MNLKRAGLRALSRRGHARLACIPAALVMLGGAMVATGSDGAADAPPPATPFIVTAPIRTGESTPLPPPPEQVQPWTTPLAFEPAERSPDGATYLARGAGYTALVGSGGAVVALPMVSTGEQETRPGRSGRSRHADQKADPGLHWVQVVFEGARRDVRGEPHQPLPSRVHRLLGSSPEQWRTNLLTHARILFSDVYPGVDVAFHGDGRQLEYDFEIAPGASPNPVRLRFDGVDSLRLTDDGTLELSTAAGPILQRRPVAYQEGPGGREPVQVAYRLRDDGTVGFAVGSYDRARTLVIDPVLAYATFAGGTGTDLIWDIEVGADGSVFVAGETESVEFPDVSLVSTNALLTEFQGGQEGVGGDAFVAKLNPDGTAFEWLTYLGGADLDAAFAIALTPSGDPVIAGFTTSTNFPLSTNAAQTELVGLTNRYTGRKPLEAFVTRLTADGSAIVASTLFGGENEDEAIDVAIMPDERLVIVGLSTSTNLPIPAASAVQLQVAGGADAFYAMFTADASAVIGGSFLGGSGRDSAEGVVLEGSEVAHIIGITASTNFPVMTPLQSTNAGLSDAFAAGIDLETGALRYSTYLGGVLDDYAYRAAGGAGGAVWIVGETASTNFPVMNALQSTNAGGADGFIARLAPNGSALEFSSFLGGTSSDALWGVGADALGNIHVAGETLSASVTGISTNSLQSTNGGLADLLIARVAGDGTAVQGTFYGSNGSEIAFGIAADTAGSAYVAGRTRSSAFPVSSTNVAQATFGGGPSDGFLLKLTYEPTLTAQLTGDAIELTWPAPNPGFVLESAASAAGEWKPTEATIETHGARHVARLPMEASNHVFRLRWVGRGSD